MTPIWARICDRYATVTVSIWLNYIGYFHFRLVGDLLTSTVSDLAIWINIIFSLLLASTAIYHFQQNAGYPDFSFLRTIGIWDIDCTPWQYSRTFRATNSFFTAFANTRIEYSHKTFVNSHSHLRTNKLPLLEKTIGLAYSHCCGFLLVTVVCSFLLVPFGLRYTGRRLNLTGCPSELLVPVFGTPIDYLKDRVFFARTILFGHNSIRVPLGVTWVACNTLRGPTWSRAWW